MKLRLILAMVVLSLGSLVGTAHAQQRAILQPAQWGNYGAEDHEQREFNSGYKDGSHAGLEDARHGRGFILYDHGSYRDHRDQEYREAFRANGYYRDRDRDSDRDWDHDNYRDRY